MKKKLIFALFAACSLALATETDIDNRVEDINARKGIDIGGTIRSASFNSYFESPQEKPNAAGVFTNRMPSHEISEFVQVDLDFKFRPWDVISANLKLRLGAGMQEYFASASTMVAVPWMNIEGNWGESFYWVVGDFRQSYSPLTLYMPGLDIMYEPVAFARKREMAQKEALMDGNQRNLQGFNLQFRPQLGETFGELRIEALGARLRRAGYLDASGAMGNMLPNEGISGATQAGRFDKFLLAGNLEWLPLNKNLLVGGTYLSITDDKSSSKYYECSNCGLNAFNKDSLLNTLDSMQQKTFVFAGRAGADVAGMLESKFLVANITGEFAMSDDKVYKKHEKGNAVLVQADVGYKSIVDVVLSNSFIRNDSAWFNNVAQSPSFFARRVLNTDKDVGCGNAACTDQTFNISKYGVYSPLYSTFDALYFFTPKHSPMAVTLSEGAPPTGAQTISYNISPYAKTSWNPSTLTRAELALLEELSDLNLQMALPGGFATSNRVGYQEVVTANWKNLAEVKGLFASYEQLSANAGAKTAKYTEFGGGAKVNILGILGYEKNPLELSGSYKHSAKEQAWTNSYGKTEYTSDFINAGVYYRFFRKFGLTFGYQQINSELNDAGALLQRNNAETLGLRVKIVPIVEATQNQWMAGIDYTIAPHAWLSINYGIIDVENTYKLDGFVDTDAIATGTNLPGYLAVNGVGKTELKHEFSRNILEATINVEF
ncbi:MAG: porin family protein [Fibromonadales bacterium]|nr:porin family protein [Fibromonadales bacterium]